ncbi:hypothetical protein FGO68_gene7839 [Halteria grandinella]|uniref:Uncharacterized protein n=1 Tax=Halteria grandinella TaxID=5974 RepID=A0A8J8NKH8_HALGN|nr:hypothetical protein FGO68_gene7839 [Halteria grandinella]
MILFFMIFASTKLQVWLTFPKKSSHYLEISYMQKTIEIGLNCLLGGHCSPTAISLLQVSQIRILKLFSSPKVGGYLLQSTQEMP